MRPLFKYRYDTTFLFAIDELLTIQNQLSTRLVERHDSINCMIGLIDHENMETNILTSQITCILTTIESNIQVHRCLTNIPDVDHKHISLLLFILLNKPNNILSHLLFHPFTNRQMYQYYHYYYQFHCLSFYLPLLFISPFL